MSAANKLVKFICLVLCVGTISPSLAKAPIMDSSYWEKKRIPAQAEKVMNLPELDIYLDLNCQELTDPQSKDEFISYFRREMKKINSDICSIVGPTPYEEQELSQAERATIGLGTFSHLMESHFHEFLYLKKLSLYQDMPCYELTNKKSEDDFIRFFSKEMVNRYGNVCSLVRPDTESEFQDISQAQKPNIGLGTFSKIIEDSFEAFQFYQGQ